ncbi:hypothetical protein SAMN03159341_12265 [Paenibacillus sp. 1_12]|uniref:hypothetical protein n=1 Tax=Paenibacillus sp. 1_12 TaxID=1566278 RepID=UPI0008EE0CE5|nr:hypothetical protein [Paenibacillus sp. 1_12]SFM25404.1 hypothetical protein SAMN03159341_12265 [Paenibacillus sp. 1_12]
MQDTYLLAVKRGQRNIYAQNVWENHGGVGVDEMEAFRFGELDAENDLIEKTQLIEAHKSLLLERSIGEVRMVHQVTKNILATYDEEQSKKS